MTSFSDVKQAEIIEAFKSTSRHLDGLLNIDNPYFEVMANHIYPPELLLNKANTSDTEAPFFNLLLSIPNGFVSSKIYDKRDDFDFDIINFPPLDGDVPSSSSYGVYISQLFRFARVSSHVADFNARNKSLTAKTRQQGCRYHKKMKVGLIFLISSEKLSKRIGYIINVMRQSACLVFNTITVNNFASLFNNTSVGRASDSVMAPT